MSSKVTQDSLLEALTELYNIPTDYNKPMVMQWSCLEVGVFTFDSDNPIEPCKNNDCLMCRSMRDEFKRLTK